MAIVKVIPGILAAILVSLLGACAGAPKTMEMDLSGALERGEGPVWPAGEEVPRYLFAGELTGEENFRAEEPDRTGIIRALAWLAGVGQETRKPVVLQRPQGGVVDEQGRVYVTDVSRQAVFVFDNIAGELKVWDYALPGKHFIAPIGIALGNAGEILVADAELGAVFRIGTGGQPLGSFGEGVLVRPTGIARDTTAGLIYVADTRSNDIKIFDDAGMLVDYIGRSGDAPGELNAPTYLAFANDHLYVTDTLNSRVQVFDRNGDMVETLGKRGLYVGNLTRPKGVAADNEGNIYVVESYYDYLLVYDNQGRFLLPIGGTGKQAGQFYLPAGVWVDSHDRVYVADMFNGRVVILQFLGGT